MHCGEENQRQGGNQKPLNYIHPWTKFVSFSFNLFSPNFLILSAPLLKSRCPSLTLYGLERRHRPPSWMFWAKGTKRRCINHFYPRRHRQRPSYFRFYALWQSSRNGWGWHCGGFAPSTRLSLHRRANSRHRRHNCAHILLQRLRRRITRHFNYLSIFHVFGSYL